MYADAKGRTERQALDPAVAWRRRPFGPSFLEGRYSKFGPGRRLEWLKLFADDAGGPQEVENAQEHHDGPIRLGVYHGLVDATYEAHRDDQNAECLNESIFWFHEGMVL